MVAIRCEGLSRFYGPVRALDDLNLTVPAGRVFGFLGRNGAGKTTTMRLLTGLARPTAGRAWVDGVEVTGNGDRGRDHFGYLPEEPAFYTWMTPRETLEYTGRLFGWNDRAREERAAELLKLVDLEGAANRPVGGFSRGMRQRLGLAQALFHRPPVLFLDEPASALDPAGRRDVLTFIDSLRGQTTVFFSSHILADVERVCDTIGVIHEGRLLLVAGREELLARYTADTALLEVTPASLERLPEFVTVVQQQAWAKAVTLEGTVVRVTVGDAATAKAALLPLLVQHGLVIERYEWARPSLEDVFLTLSGEG